MKLPSETLLDSLQCLDRPSLDAVQISSKQFLNFVTNKLRDVCLRRLNYASVTEAHGDKGKIQGSYKLTVMEREEKASTELEEHAGERFAKMIESSHIERLTFLGVPLTDRLFQQLQPALNNVHVDYLLVRWCDYTTITPSVFVDTITSLGSIRGILRISGSPHILPGHVNNLLVDYAAEHGTREVYLPLPCDDASFDVTDESILNFLTGPKNGTTIKKLEVSKPSISARFLERLIEAHQTGRITSNVDMKLWDVDVPQPSTNSVLQFTTVDVEHGTAVVFGMEIKLVTKFGHTDVEYEGRTAGIEGEE